MEASSTDANLFFVGGSIDLLLITELQVEQRPVNIAISKKKAGQEAFLMLSRPA